MQRIVTGKKAQKGPIKTCSKQEQCGYLQKPKRMWFHDWIWVTATLSGTILSTILSFAG